MKQLSLVFVALCAFTASHLFGQAGTEQQSWKSYGEPVRLKKATSLATLLKTKDQMLQKEVLIKGMISEVCENKGCWMVIEDGKEHVRVEFANYAFFVPWDSNGKKARVQGRLKEKTISASTAQHVAGEMKKPPVQKDKIQDKQTIIVFVASGVAIEGGGAISPEQQAIIEGKNEHHEHSDEEHDH